MYFKSNRSFEALLSLEKKKKKKNKKEYMAEESELFSVSTNKYQILYQLTTSSVETNALTSSMIFYSTLGGKVQPLTHY